MTEDEARQKLHDLVPHDAAHLAKTFVETEVAKIYQLGQGKWDPRAAQKYVTINLGASLLPQEDA